MNKWEKATLVVASILILLGCLLLGSVYIARAQGYVEWNVDFAGCRDGEYLYRAENTGTLHLSLLWWGDTDHGVTVLYTDTSVTFSTPDSPIEVAWHGGKLTAEAGNCTQLPAYTYLIAVLDVNDPPVWSCGGDFFTTPLEYITLNGEQIGVSVLILSEYRNPSECHTLDIGPKWYVDYPRYTCIAYKGKDEDCPGVAIYQ